MPYLIYVRSLRGITPQVIRDDAALGVEQKMPKNMVAAHKLEEHQTEFSIDLLTAIYPYSGE